MLQCNIAYMTCEMWSSRTLFTTPSSKRRKLHEILRPFTSHPQKLHPTIDKISAFFTRPNWQSSRMTRRIKCAHATLPLMLQTSRLSENFDSVCHNTNSPRSLHLYFRAQGASRSHMQTPRSWFCKCAKLESQSTRTRVRLIYPHMRTLRNKPLWHGKSSRLSKTQGANENIKQLIERCM